MARSGDKGTEHFLFLDGMRGIAALFVGVLHASNILLHGFSNLPNAHLAVDFFFCLSGFVIAHAYGDRLLTTMTAAEFLRRRIIRLGPLLVFGTCLGSLFIIVGALTHHGMYQPLEAVTISALALFLVPSGFLYGLEAYPPNNPVWSIFFELVANVAYACWPIRSAIANRVGIVALAAALICAGVYYETIEHLGYSTPATFLGGFFRVGYPFAAGVAIYHLGWFKNRHQLWSWAALVGVTLLLVWPVGTWQTDIVAILLFIPLLVIAGMARAGPRSAYWFALMGEISYPFYLIHQPLLRLLKYVPALARAPLYDRYFVIGLVIVLTAFAALGLSRFFDLPVRRYLARTAARSPARVSAVQSL